MSLVKKREKSKCTAKITGFKVTRDGITQVFYETDYDNRKDFLDDRDDFIRAGVEVKDIRG